ncbi:uncharacterized protein TRUGW13939_10349 [Talaromyces rugulosus]|uniref:Uncharacterized protein n=1 Tax=Talaromyces rugulosus TaxID=121627 RepID=A0A7H8R9U0_TALRU|nr:uncharacterized protein TRUGW13939_10349 [Talaromyces rugulosus]QKX63180.1 hypothetical protein TRUGW13939_10349 [Talaromyces rugulosus]
MGRRKALCTIPLQSGGSYESLSSIDICTKDFLQQKYDQSLSEPHQTTLYADTTIGHINRIETLFTEYCDILQLDPRETLRQCEIARLENFLHWMLKVYNIKKTSAVTTYWRQLSQLHITWWHFRIEPMIMKQVFVFIQGTLTKEYNLDSSEREPQLLEAEDFVQVIQYLWASDINVFPNERQRVQVAAILLLAAFTGSRPGALLQITYRDLRLYVEKNRKTKKHELKLGVKLTKTKSGKKRQRPKTYTFNLDDNPVFCIVSHISSLAFDDGAFWVPELVSADELYSLRARNGWNQTIPWNRDMLDVPIFRRAIKTPHGMRTSSRLGLTYRQYHGWVVRLGEALDFTDTLTTYSLRQNLGNVINDDPNSNAAVRNLVMDHTMGSGIFERNYLSRRIRYSTQDAFWGRETDHESAKAASRIQRFRDPNRPRKLTLEQKQEVRHSRQVLELTSIRDRLCMQIEETFGVVKMAEGEPIHRDYQAVRRQLDSTIRATERALLKRAQEDYDTVAPVLAIQRQLNGEITDDEDDSLEIEMTEIRLAERRQIAEVALRDPSTFMNRKGFGLHVEFVVNMTALCRRRERPRLRKHQPQKESPSKVADGPTRSIKLEPEIKRDQPLTCGKFQCLFCLAEGLPLEDCQYKRKYTLQKHVDRWHLRGYGSGDLIPCPDTRMCSKIVINGKMAFKVHSAKVHGFIL